MSKWYDVLEDEYLKQKRMEIEGTVLLAHDTARWGKRLLKWLVLPLAVVMAIGAAVPHLAPPTHHAHHVTCSR